MNKNQINIALLGAGRIGNVHAQNIAHRIPEASLVAICDVFEESAASCARRLGVASWTTRPEEVLRRDDVDAVVICTATHTHADLIIQAANAGKHIFCEKPIDFDLKRIHEALQVVQEAGVTLQVGFNRRFDANAIRIRRAVEEKEIGEPHRLHIVSRDPSPPPPSYVESSGGIFVDMTIHDFDMARFILGCEATEVYTLGGVKIDPRIGELGDLDTVLIALTFENGVICTIDNSRKAVYGYDQRMEVFGSAGSIESSNEFPNSTVIRTAEAVRRDLPLHFFIERYEASFVREIQAFVEAVQGQMPAPVQGIDGLRPVVMGIAARKSFDEKRPVRLEEVWP